MNRREFLAGTVASSAWARGLTQTGGMSGGSTGAQARRAPSRRPYSQFTDVALAAGLGTPVIYGGIDHIRYIIESMGGGCAFFDYDNDGWMDIFLLGGTRLEGAPTNAGNRLYRNNRDGTFTDVTLKAGLHDVGWACGVCVGDYNNDGFEDLFCTYYGQNRLYRNNGDGTFSDVTRRAGLLQAGVRFATGCSFFDYDRDGHLDLFIANYVEFDLAHPPEPEPENPTCTFEGSVVYCGPRGLPAGQHSLFHNNGDGTFSDVSQASGIAKHRGSYGMTALTGDFDNDGWQDIFLACDSTPSLLLLNNRDGTFREEGFDRGVAVSGEGSEQAGMGVGAGDITLNGSTSLFVTHFQQQASGLYENDGKGNFTDATLASRIAVETKYVGWGASIADFDNDGLPDILWVTGNVYPEMEKKFARYPFKGPRILFRNLGDGTFEELAGEAGQYLNARHASRGLAVGDFDNDGDLDVLIMNVNEPPTLLRNDAPGGNGWLKLKLIGTRSNRSAIGARVIAKYGGRTQMQEVRSQCSYLSSDDPRVHFGLGTEASVQVEIVWPSGLRENLGSQKKNRLLTVLEGKGIQHQVELGGIKWSGKKPPGL